MEFVLVVVALGLAGAWAGVHLALRARAESGRLRALNQGLESRVSERTQALQAALEASAEQARRLKRSDDAKSDFLAGMSHELRTPLNAVIGFAELLRMNAPAEPLTARQTQAVEQIRASGRHLLALIDEVLDLARVEAGRLSLSVERVDPHLVIRQVCDSLRPQAEAAGVTLTAPRPTAGPGVRADRTRLRQILLNLVSNAIKYNRPGGTVVVETVLHPDGMAVCVHDTGQGLPAGRMAELFQPFSRLGRETGEIQGVGVGLTLSQRLAQAMDGRIEVVSREGEGSTFTVHLPRGAAPSGVDTRAETGPVPQAAGPAEMLGDLPLATVLYVEDNPSNIALMRQVVPALGPLRLHVAETGHEGLALARDLRPDVILLDINLPGLDGFEVKARLDADPLTRDVPVVALSAGAMPADLRRGREAGFLAYLTKPLDIPALARALSQALGSPRAEAA